MHAPSEILDRLPPQDMDAERATLGSVLLNPAVLDDVAAVVRPDSFHADAHRRIFAALLAMRDRCQAIDPATLVDRLRQTGDLEAVGGVAYLAQVSSSVPVSAHATYYARIVARKAKYREMIHAATELLRDAYAETDDPAEILDRAEARMMGIDAADQADAPVPLPEAARQAMVRIEQIRNRKRQAGAFTGLIRFDEKTGGLFGGELTILAARPGVGKTALALQISHHMAARNRLVYFASLEMSAVELSTRLLCATAGVSSTAIRANTINDRDLAALTEAWQNTGEAPILIHDRAGITVNQVRRAARRLKRNGLAMVVVDYLQRISPDDRSIPRYEQVGRMTDGLKSLARELDVPVLCLCQLNRAAEKEDYPQLQHLRESGAIEQDADMVLFIHRKVASYTPGDGDRDAQLLIAKNRNGDTGAIKLQWDPRRTTFECCDRHYPEFDAGTEDF